MQILPWNLEPLLDISACDQFPHMSGFLNKSPTFLLYIIWSNILSTEMVIKWLLISYQEVLFENNRIFILFNKLSSKINVFSLQGRMTFMGRTLASTRPSASPPAAWELWPTVTSTGYPETTFWTSWNCIPSSPKRSLETSKSLLICVTWVASQPNLISVLYLTVSKLIVLNQT